jgi:hypothetical protein
VIFIFIFITLRGFQMCSHSLPPPLTLLLSPSSSHPPALLPLYSRYLTSLYTTLHYTTLHTTPHLSTPHRTIPHMSFSPHLPPLSLSLCALLIFFSLLLYHTHQKEQSRRQHASDNVYAVHIVSKL